MVIRYNSGIYRVQHRFQNITCRAGQAAPKVYLPHPTGSAKSVGFKLIRFYQYDTWTELVRGKYVSEIKYITETK